MSAVEALARTALLVQQELFPSASAEEIVDVLTHQRVRLRADDANVATPAGQSALVAIALLIAQLGARVDVRCPDIALLGPQPPLTPQQPLRTGLLDLLDDLITPPGPIAEPDITVLLGDTPATRDDGGWVVRIGGDDWHADLRAGGGSAPRWTGALPFGAVLGAIVVAGEVFRRAIGRLSVRHQPSRQHPLEPPEAVTVGVPPLERVMTDLGAIDAISAGAITNAALFTLFRMGGAVARVRVLDRDEGALSNLNRYLLLRGSTLGLPKVDVLASLAPEGWIIEPDARRYDSGTAAELELRPTVLVGVDHIPSRWLVQKHAPGWVCVSGTSGADVVVSTHEPGTACAGCLHPEDDLAGGEIATVSFVSALAGLLQAYRLVRRVSGYADLPPTLAFGLNLPSPHAMLTLGQAVNPACPVGCRASARGAA